MTGRTCVCEGEFIWACGPECPCFHHRLADGTVVDDTPLYTERDLRKAAHSIPAGRTDHIDPERLDMALVSMGLDWPPGKRADFIAFYEDTDDD